MSATPHDREAIFNACEQSMKNGSNILNWSPEEVADELQFYLYEASNMQTTDLVPICKEWLESKK